MIPGWLKFSDDLRDTGLVGKTVRQGFGALIHLVGHLSDGRHERPIILGLIRTVLGSSEDGFSTAESEAIRELLAENYSPFEVDRLLSELKNTPPLTAEDAGERLKNLPETEKYKLLQSLLTLAVGSGNLETKKAFLSDLSVRLGIDGAHFSAMREEVRSSRERRQKIIRSGAGILVALIVLAVFILTATLLRAVIFGLIAAYLLLPVEKYFERKLRSESGFLHGFFDFCGMWIAPLRKLSESLTRRPSDFSETRELKERKRNRKIIAQAVGCTSIFVLVLVLVIGSVLSSITGKYVGRWSRQVQNWTSHYLTQQEASAASAAMEPPNPSAAASAKTPVTLVSMKNSEPTELKMSLWVNGAEQTLIRAQNFLEQLRVRFANLPLVKLGIEEIGAFLNNPEAQRELAGILLKRTGGIFSFTATVLGIIGALLADLLLTVFFFLLFLSKLAEFCEEGDSEGRQSEYLVRTVFNGNWLPGAKPETIAEAQRIIGEVIAKLRIWVRGYITLMLVDGTVYTSMFYFLKVPYFWLLGPVAGCGILLPYIGPICSALLTVLVMLAAGGGSTGGLQLFGVLLTYLLYNGVLEQFILYPMVIGESLGLTTLETIIVVLLGAIFAGIAGMILAIPAASIIKYLVPQIYRCWEK